MPLPGGELTSHCPHCLLNLALGEDPEPAVGGARAAVPPARVRYFGDFELMEEVARGGMGVVWKARQLTLQRVVALKMIHAGHLASAEARVRFEAEIEATARLEHPNIVPLLETGEHDGVHFFTMKLLAGGDLTARRADLALPGPGEGMGTSREWRERQARLVRLVVKIARAVHYAHRRGILHRDLKPSNVLLDDAGEPHVVDFGLAKMLTRESAFTFTQSILGSPNYMAPEQAIGKTDELTMATDVYGLGAIFYELLTGRPPFRGDSPMATLRQVIDSPPLAPRKVHPGIDPDLDTICLKCLEKSPANRYATAEELADDLGRWLDRRPIQARRARTWEHAWRWCQREPALATALVGCLVMLIAVAIGSSVAAVRIGRAEQSARAALREAQVSQARSLRLTSEVGHRAEGLRLLGEANQSGVSEAFRRRLRDEFLATVVRTDLEFVSDTNLQAARDPFLNVVSSGAGSFASLTGTNTVLVRDLVSGGAPVVLELGGLEGIRPERLSADGRYLGVRDAEGISVWEVDSGKCLWRTNGPRRVFEFAPDRPLMVVEEWDQRATLLSLPGMEEVGSVRSAPPLTSSSLKGWTALALSPGGKTLVVAHVRDRVMDWIDVEGDRVFRRTTNRADVVMLAWSPDGTRLAAALENGRVPVFSPRGSMVFDLAALTQVARSVAFNADASLMAVLGRDRTLRLVDTEAIRDAFAVRCDGGTITFDASGTRMGPIVRGEEVGWFEMRRPKEFRHVTIARTRDEFDACAYSPDGRTLLVGNERDVVFCEGTGDRRLLGLSRWAGGSWAWDPIEGSLFRASTAGVERRSVGLKEDLSLELGEAQVVVAGRGLRRVAFSATGTRWVGVRAPEPTLCLFDRSFGVPLAQIHLPSVPDVTAISPDARWAATAGASEREAKIWDLAAGTCLNTFPTGTSPQVAFSPDGQWLVMTGDTFTLLRTGSWEASPPVPVPEDRPLLGAAAFSPDGRMLAVVCDRFHVQLVDLRTFRPLGLLRAPGLAEIRCMAFSPDGSRLAGTGTLGRLQIWDLRGLQGRLQEMGLAWDWPAPRAQ